MRLTPIAQAVISHSLRSLVERPAPAPMVAPVRLDLPVCLACGRQHLASLICPAKAWASRQEGV